MNEQDAIIAASKIDRKATIFKWLAVGASFRFPNSEQVFTKRNRYGWYSDGVRKFRTGVLTAVVPV